MRVLTGCNLAELVVDLLNGQTVVFPTETSYGLGCDATNQAAVDRIFKIKGRGNDKPLLVVVPTVEMARKYLAWSDLLGTLATQYWPGPLTVVGASTATSPSQRRGQGEVSLSHREFSFERIVGFVKNLSRRRELRRDSTKAEKILWSHLQNKRLGGLKFRRQHGIGPFIVDFFHPETKTIIELDGDIHFAVEVNEKKDRQRERWLEDQGYNVVRYNNVDIFSNLDGILKELYVRLTEPLPAPSPLRRRGELAVGVVSKDNTVAIRVTADPLLKSITEKLGRPLVATSANVTDSGDSYSAKAVIAGFQNRVDQPDIILDYGEILKLPSTTIVSVVGGNFKILRQGKQEVKI